jgi:hypothetical protein
MQVGYQSVMISRSYAAIVLRTARIVSKQTTREKVSCDGTGSSLQISS